MPILHVDLDRRQASVRRQRPGFQALAQGEEVFWVDVTGML